MASNYETFFDCNRYAVIGHSSAKPFPLLSYRGLKKLGKQVVAIDPSAQHIDGDPAYSDLSALPESVDAVIIEAPKTDTKDWIARAAEAGIKHVWIHMGHDTPEACALAEQHGMNVRTGTCAVMYLKPGLSYHSIHQMIMKALGKY
ncbi:CoA-binding protein [Rhabdochromatium marinum]|uniref:CoA-binding protein n=1 Tax=Rhabdochromatium marinum TaxID=48729 RepID=UPI0019033D1F|nr:CoA-binding protein [Rhabdochromatium marinum]MBK1647995.1 CoA-binding protein [Rhabdochromatium marinum]